MYVLCGRRQTATKPRTAGLSEKKGEQRRGTRTTASKIIRVPLLCSVHSGGAYMVFRVPGFASDRSPHDFFRKANKPKRLDQVRDRRRVRRLALSTDRAVAGNPGQPARGASVRVRQAHQRALCESYDDRLSRPTTSWVSQQPSHKEGFQKGPSPPWLRKRRRPRVLFFRPLCPTAAVAMSDPPNRQRAPQSTSRPEPAARGKKRRPQNGR